VSRLSRKCGSLDVSQPYGPVTGIALPSKYKSGQLLLHQYSRWTPAFPIRISFTHFYNGFYDVCQFSVCLGRKLVWTTWYCHKAMGWTVELFGFASQKCLDSSLPSRSSTLLDPAHEGTDVPSSSLGRVRNLFAESLLSNESTCYIIKIINKEIVLYISKLPAIPWTKHWYIILSCRNKTANHICLESIAVAARSKAWTAFDLSNTGIVGSNHRRGMDVCVCLFCVHAILCAGSCLATGWSLVQGVLPTVYGVKKPKKWRSSNKGL
jgi:hypothetical protein